MCSKHDLLWLCKHVTDPGLLVFEVCFTPEIHGLLAPIFAGMLGDGFRWHGGQREKSYVLPVSFPDCER